jgi:SOS-response transcriptional repressor LexA
MTNSPQKTAVLGARITERRKTLKLKQKELAELMGVTPQAVNYWERRNGIEATKLPKLAEILETSMSYLMGVEQQDSTTGGKSVIRVDNKVTRLVPLGHLGHLSELKMANSRAKSYANGETAITTFPASDKAIAFEIIDTSMSPEYAIGDIVTIEPDLEVEPGDHVVARILSKDVETFREFRYEGADYYLLAPLHPHHQTLRFTHEQWEADVAVVGVMVSQFREGRRARLARK